MPQLDFAFDQINVHEMEKKSYQNQVEQIVSKLKLLWTNSLRTYNYIIVLVIIFNFNMHNQCF